MQDYFLNKKLNFSSLKEIDRSPAHFKYKLEHKEPSTPAMAFGSLVHCLILEPQTLADRYIEAPKCDRRTKEGKAIYEAFLSTSNGKEVVSSDDMAQAQEIAKIVLSSAEVQKIISQGKAEQTLEGIIDGVEMKGRLDFIADSFILDVKTCQDANPKSKSFSAFSKSIHKFHYDAQAYIYQALVRQSTGKTLPYIFLAIEKEAPYGFALYHLPAEYLEIGQKKVEKWLRSYKKCLADDFWPCYEKAIQKIEIPNFIINDFMEEV